MLTADFDYHLPRELIAQTPSSSRDESRLMVVLRGSQSVKQRHFFDLPEFLQPGDVIVWNNSKVFKARLRGRVMLDEQADGLPQTTGDNSPYSDVILNLPSVEIFLVRPMENPGTWKVLAKPGKRLRLGMKVVFAQDFEAEIIAKEPDGTILVQFNDDDAAVRAKANRYGQVPLPPYIMRDESRIKNQELRNVYQTVYAKEEGSVAAPTAGFHFTPALIERLKNQGVQFAEVTLHVGLGTFLPVKTERVAEHVMHAEQVELTAKNADIINLAKREGRRVIAVGTTTVRTLEGIARLEGDLLKPFTGDINIFITPGFEFKIVDALITNFHLPKSTLLMLVSAFAGDREFMLDCYRQAVEAKYRFYSFGDAMFIV